MKLDPQATGPCGALRVRGCRLWCFPTFNDERGNLTVAELEQNMPFPVKRVFFVYDAPGDGVRGGHAHRTCSQLLLTVRGSVSVLVDDGSIRDQVRLNCARIGFLLPPNIWSQYGMSNDAVLVVFASHPYDPADYVRKYEEFQSIVDAIR